MPYESARDLPSFVEMEQQLKAANILTLFFARSERPKLAQIRVDMRRIASVVDQFYDLLGPRNWIFHDDLNLEAMADLAQSADAEQAERQLVDYYKDPETLRFKIMRLNGLEAMRPRLPLISLAQEDFHAGRYYAVVHVLLSVMDGFVNEWDPAARRGLHARDEEELDAWDSVVGHHRGLAAAHKTFRRTFKATSDEPVYELYRNGIVHGNLLNYNNEVVATKAWNRLFAVADWAKAEVKRQAPKAPEPTWRELFSQIAENERDKKLLAAFQPRSISQGDADFEEEEVHSTCSAFLTAWKSSNFGGMAASLAHLVKTETERLMPVQVREEYSDYNLESFSIKTLEFPAAAVCLAGVDLVVNGTAHECRLRWIREEADGSPVPVGRPDGEWKLIIWGPFALLSDST